MLINILRRPKSDTVFKTTGIGYHVDRPPSVTAIFKVAGETVRVEATELLARELLVLNDLQKFQISSVIDYALECGEDPVAALDRARERGHSLVWINGLPSVISQMQPEPENYIRVRHGVVVLFQGRIYRIDPANNRNLKLTPYVPSLANAEVA